MTRSVPAGVIGAEERLGVLVTFHLPGRFAFVWQSGNGSSLYVYTSVHTCKLFPTRLQVTRLRATLAL
jgi:hypothetical protein